MERFLVPLLLIPEGATPADLFGETDLLPGQDWLDKETLLVYASAMQASRFPWARMQTQEPMAIHVGTNGKVLTQGHHRWAAARLAGVAIPVEIVRYTDYLNAGMVVPFARTWVEVVWK
jgi:hypothetical protein